jgi:hypothetical protein
MKNSPDIQARSEDAIHQWLDPHFTLLRHLTVRLYGSAKGGKGAKGGVFQGSGVVLGVNGDQVFVLTAKHNLHTAGQPGNVRADQLVNNFKANVKAYVTPAGGAQEVSGAIDDVTFPVGTVANTGYDVALLRVRSADCAGAVRDLAPPNSARAPFTPAGWRQNGSGRIVEWRALDVARGVLMNGTPYRGDHRADQENHLLLQFGYGKIGAGADDAFRFGYRALKAADLGNPAYMDASHDGAVDVFVFDATSQTTTTYEGDSGGPIFAIPPDGASSFLLAVTLGANVYADRTDNNPQSKTVNNANTLVTTDKIALNAVG